ISTSSNFNGKALLDGSAGTLSFQVGTGADAKDRIEYDSSKANSSTSSLGISGADVISKDGAYSSMSSLDEAMNKVNSIRSGLGAMQNRLNSASNNSGVAYENLSAARSRIADADMAVESSNLSKAQIQQRLNVICHHYGMSFGKDEHGSSVALHQIADCRWINEDSFPGVS
ncbi:MAG: hypothetical protein EOP06_26385, partial [Proteobacteria bacterium]